MERMEPQRAERRDLRPLNSPSETWRLDGGLLGGGLVYLHVTGVRAYVHVDDAGDVDVAGSDAAGESRFPDREALDTIVWDDVRRLQDSGRQDDAALLMLVGFDEFRTVRSYRGRKKWWDSTKLVCLACDVERDGIRVAAERWQLSSGRVRELMHEAERLGLVRIEKAGSRNTYVVVAPREGVARSPRERADWHRASWLELGRKRRDLQANWERVSLLDREPGYRLPASRARHAATASADPSPNSPAANPAISSSENRSSQ